MHAVVDERDEHLRLREGDADAWRDFYRRVYPTMVAYARRRLDSLEGARDAASEALARTARTVARMAELEVTPEAWGFGILRNVVLDAQRRQAREWRVVGSPELAPALADERALLAEEHDQVRRAFARLSERDREVLELRVVAGLSSDEVASVLSMNPGAVRMAHSRALSRLRDLLEVEP
jgi:RNA polymerase sigma-70 factor (ECF subfamily)